MLALVLRARGIQAARDAGALPERSVQHLGRLRVDAPIVDRQAVSGWIAAGAEVETF